MRTIATVLAAGGLLLSSGVLAQEGPAPSPPAVPGATGAMTRTMDPQAMGALMGQVLDPAAMLTNPIATCSACHTQEHVTRYQETMGPMLQMMKPMSWVDPNAYARMITPMVDPETYRQWYDAYTKKFGSFADQYQK